MCGILGYFGKHIVDAKALIKKLKHRGPDGTNIVTGDGFILGFALLSINGEAGMQPVQKGSVYVVCNGEIYNYKQLAADYGITIPEGGSDCSILPELFVKTRSVTEFCRVLDGVFAMIVVNNGNPTVIRDPYGVRPLFMEEKDAFASEAKALPNLGGHIQQFPAGTFFQNGRFRSYHEIPYIKQPFFKNTHSAEAALHDALTTSVKKRLLSDRPIGALLSGGLDSSLIVAILSKHVGNLQTFSIGLADSEDLRCARIVANHCKTKHHEIVITEKQYQDAIEDVIKSLESHDVTTVRASVGNWLVGQYIRKNTDIKVVFNGDGSDEIGGGYRYFQKAPSNVEFENECVRLLEDIRYFDVLRSDRCISAHGLEPRTPYLDKQFVATWLSIPTSLRRTKIEKQVLRHAFAGYLPSAILYRKKEAFSDGMSQNAPWKSIPNEEEYYKELYNKYYSQELVPYKWMPKWSPETSDPSAKTLNNY
jgi:asparagine synthase (glutamine-hydrolysing)